MLQKHNAIKESRYFLDQVVQLIQKAKIKVTILDLSNNHLIAEFCSKQYKARAELEVNEVFKPGIFTSKIEVNTTRPLEIESSVQHKIWQKYKYANYNDSWIDFNKKISTKLEQVANQLLTAMKIFDKWLVQILSTDLDQELKKIESQKYQLLQKEIDKLK